MSRFVLSLAVAGAAVSILPLSTATLASEAEGRPVGTSMAGRWGAAYNKGDIPAIVALYTEDAELLPKGTQAIKGHAAIRSFFETMRAHGPSDRIGFGHIESYGGPRAASEIADVVVRDGQGHVVVLGRQILVLLKQNGRWKIYRDMWTNNDRPST